MKAVTAMIVRRKNLVLEATLTNGITAQQLTFFRGLFPGRDGAIFNRDRIGSSLIHPRLLWPISPLCPLAYSLGCWQWD